MPVFDYAALPQEQRDRLAEIAADVAECNLRLPVDALNAGRLLTDARGILFRAGWRDWIDAEFSWPYRTAERLVSVARVFGHLPTRQIVAFASSALYLLAAKTCPAGARGRAISDAAAGKQVTYSRARELLQSARPTVTPQQALELPTIPGDEPTIPSLTEQHKLWLALESLLSKSTMLHFGREVEDESGDDTYRLVSGVAYLADQGRLPVHVMRETLADVVKALSGTETPKRCIRCGKRKAPGQFSFDASQSDGRNKYCRVCERRRVAAYDKAKRRKVK